MRPFRTRTLLLMLVALLAFARLWWVTHPPKGAASATGDNVIPVVPLAADGGT